MLKLSQGGTKSLVSESQVSVKSLSVLRIAFFFVVVVNYLEHICKVLFLFVRTNLTLTAHIHLRTHAYKSSRLN